MQYYNYLVIITCLYMIIQLVQLYEDQTLSRKERSVFSIIAVCILLGTICEFCGEFLNNTPSQYRILHGIIKAIELSIAPCIPILYCLAVDFEKKVKIRKIVIISLLSINSLIEIISIFKPLIFQIKQENVYVHSRFYYIYVMYYVLGIIYFIYIFLKATKKYQNINLLSLISIIIFFLIGFTLTKLFSEIKTDWLIISMIYSTFIHYYTKLILKIDALTLLLNRRSYENQLRTINYKTAVIKIDVNNFKNVNDTYGHHCGDVCLRIVASVIYKAYGKIGWCYRTGGDEFDVILKPNKLDDIVINSSYDVYKGINIINSKFEMLLSEQYKEYPMLKSGVSIGYGIFYGYVDSFDREDDKNSCYNMNISDVVDIADKRMYQDKTKKKKLH